MVSALKITITGRVQGVFFRVETKKFAAALGITGWVYNTDDGKVEIHAEGKESVLEKLKEWCKKGPPSANVEKVIFKNTSEEHFTSFEIRR